MKCTIGIPAPKANVITRELTYTVNEDAIYEEVALKLTDTEFVVCAEQNDQLAFELIDINESGDRSEPRILEFTIDTELLPGPSDMILISVEE